MWRGPYGCELCHTDWFLYPGAGELGGCICGGKLVPYDRRAVSDEIVEEMARALFHVADSGRLGVESVCIVDKALARYRVARGDGA
jgi:hypothetical protein